MRILIFAALIFVVQTASPCSAKEKPPELSVGMEYSEVLTRAGAPESKKIMETKREEEWFYRNYSVVFREGRVIRLTGVLELIPQGQRQPAPSEAREAERRKQTPPDLLRNILKELPVPSPAQGSAPAGSAPPGQPMPMNEE